MARFESFGLDDLISDFGALAELPDEVVEEMLRAEAAVVEKAQKTELRALGLVRTGQLVNSIGISEKVRTKNGSKVLYLYPKGSRSDEGKERTNTEVGFIYEFGAPARHIPAYNWMKHANENCHEEAVEAAAKVYDKFLKQKNL